MGDETFGPGHAKFGIGLQQITRVVKSEALAACFDKMTKLPKRRTIQRRESGGSRLLGEKQVERL